MRLPAPTPGRECGACTACCTEMAVDDPQLQKPANVACRHLAAGQGCGIHEHLPSTCRAWYCGWRFLTLSDAMRPDLSNVMLSPELGSVPGFEKGGLRVILMGGKRGALLQDELLDLIAKCVTGGVPIFLSWGDGAFAKRGLINDAARPAIEAGDKPAFVRVLHNVLDQMAQQVAMDVITAQNQSRS